MSHDLPAGSMELPTLRDPRKRAYLAALVKTCGHHGRAAEAAGIDRKTAWRWKTGDGHAPDPVYLQALEVAEELAAQHLEDVATQRATEGMRSYKFTSRGEPLRHPKLCECGHSKAEHVKGGPCLGPDCDCDEFEGEPYYEDEISDRLLQFLLRGARPEKFAERHVHSGVLRNINWDALPDWAIARMSAGEHPYSVLAAAADQGVQALLPGPDSPTAAESGLVAPDDAVGRVEIGGAGTQRAARDEGERGGGGTDG